MSLVTLAPEIQTGLPQFVNGGVEVVKMLVQHRWDKKKDKELYAENQKIELRNFADVMMSLCIYLKAYGDKLDTADFMYFGGHLGAGMSKLIDSIRSVYKSTVSNNDIDYDRMLPEFDLTELFEQYDWAVFYYTCRRNSTGKFIFQIFREKKLDYSRYQHNEKRITNLLLRIVNYTEKMNFNFYPTKIIDYLNQVLHDPTQVDHMIDYYNQLPTRNKITPKDIADMKLMNPQLVTLQDFEIHSTVVEAIERKLLQKSKEDKKDKERKEYSKAMITKALIPNYKKFMMLINKYPEEILAPTQEIDKIWHIHRSYTQFYSNDCYSAFRQFIHHTPLRIGDELKTYFERTKILWFQEYKEHLQGDICICACF